MTTPPTKLKRSRRLALTTLMATAGVNLTACDTQPPDAVTWDDSFNRPAASSPADPGEGVDAMTYSDLNACKAAGEVPAAECDTAWQAAQADHQQNAPRFTQKELCEQEYGVGNCETRTSNGGSFFTPFLAGMVIGNLLDGGGRRYYGTGLYRDRYGRFATPYSRYGGGGLYRSPSTGRLQVGRNAIAPPPGYAPSGYARGGSNYGSGYSAPGSVREPTRTVSRGGFRSSGRGGYGG